jgi:hypothetical protein
MKPFTEKQKQWLWFVALCLGGLSATFILATLGGIYPLKRI